MRRVLVIGIGSLIMQDDGIGTRVAKALEQRLKAQGIPVIAGETDFQYCFDEILPDDIPVILDAMLQEQEAGSIAIFPLSEVTKSRGTLRAQHEFSLFDAIALNYPDMHGYLIGIEAAHIDLGFSLSVPLRERFESICAAVYAAVLKIKEDASHA